MSYVKFDNIHKKYPKAEKFTVTKFDLDIKKGEFVVFVGPSGCGKSTTLRMLAGLEEISDGEISIDGRVVNDVHPKDRDIAMVFQNYALYPHMSVYDNIGFGLKIKKMPKDQIKAKIMWAADILGLVEYLDRKPKDLSGGQRQRVALGRAIVRNPKVFLMDEPLSNLDAKLRVSMRNEITKLHRELEATTIYVTHDQVEAMTMADRIVVLKDGIIQQIGSPMELYSKPANLFVAGFIGAPQMNLFEVDINNGVIELPNKTKIAIPEGRHFGLKGKTGKYTLGIRPEHMLTNAMDLTDKSNEVVSCTVENLERMGHDNHVFAKLGSSDLILKLSGEKNIQFGDKISFRIDLNNAHFFEKASGERVL